MTIKTPTIIFVYLTLIFVVPTVSALTLQELINSYNFGYTDNTLTINFFNDYMKDSNSDGKNDTLVINFIVNSTKTDYFQFFIDLSQNTGALSNNLNQSISSGVQNLNISFDTSLLTKGRYNYSLKVYNSNSTLVFSRYSIETNDYGLFDNGIGIQRIIDENINNNYIRINLTLNVISNQDANITAYLKFNSTIISAAKQITLPSGLQTASIDFDNETIKSTHYNGKFALDSVAIGRKIIHPVYTTLIYNYEDFAKTSYFRNYSSAGIDTNANDLSEFLETNFTVAVKNDDTYEVQTEIYDQFNNYIKNLSAIQSLSIGNKTVSVRINGSDIYSAKIIGPYILSLTKLIENGNIIDKQLNPYTISNLTYTDFERPPLPDLIVNLNVSFNQATNISNLTVQILNDGKAPAFNIFLDIFNNETFSTANNTMILNVNQSQDYAFIVANTSNATLFTAIADFNNLVDETNKSNNIAQNTKQQFVSLKIDSISAMHSNATMKIFEFTILNDGSATVNNIKWQFDTNDNNVINSSSDITLAPNEKAFVYVKHNFSSTGNFNVLANATGTSSSNILSSSLSSNFGIGDLSITNFSGMNIKGTRAIFEIRAKNNINENVSSINWSLDTKDNSIINANQLFALKPNETIFIFVENNYSRGGTYAPAAAITSQLYSDTKSASVSTSTAPVITTIPDISFDEDTYNNSLNLSNYASDAEDSVSALAWSASNNANIIVKINQTTKQVKFTALANWHGSESINFTVNDTSGLTANDTITVTVNAVNDAPAFTGTIQNMIWPEDIVNDSLNLSKYFYDVDGDMLSYTSSGATNIAVSVNNDTGIASLIPNANWNGIDYVTFTAKDPSGAFAISNNLTLNITAVNDPPTFTNTIPNWKWPEDSTNASLNLTQYFSDIDGDSLIYNFTSVDNITISVSNNTGIVAFTPDANFNGIRYVIFTATDTSNSTASSNNLTLNVTPVNDPPTIESYIPLNLKISAVAGSNLIFNHTSGDIDGDVLSYSWKLDGIEKSAQQGWTYASTANEIGAHNITLNVSDGTASAGMQWNITVLNRTSINVYGFSLPDKNSTLAVFGFSINNTGKVNLTGINWSLNTGIETIAADKLISLAPNESISIFVKYNYTKTGEYIAAASAADGNYSGSESLALDVEDVELSNLSVLSLNGTKAIFELTIENKLAVNLTNVSWSFDAKDGNAISSTIGSSLQPSEKMPVYISYNFTSAGTYNVNAAARNGTLIDYGNLTVFVS